VDEQAVMALRPYPLGALVHDQYHHAANAIMAALDVSSRDAYELENLTPGEQLPAGPETAPWIMVGGSHARDYPNHHISRVIDRALGAKGTFYTAWAAKIMAVLPQLAAYEPLLQSDAEREIFARLGKGWAEYQAAQKPSHSLRTITRLLVIFICAFPWSFL